MYLLFLAINGVTESFVFSVMKEKQVERQEFYERLNILIVNCLSIYSYNRKMLFFSVIFIILSLLLTKLFGGIGFILANGANMLARIIHR